MKLQEKHNEFAVKCFAKLMKPSEVAEALIEEFSQDFPQPPTPPELPSFEQEIEGVEYQFNKDEYIELKMEEVRKRFFKTYGFNSEKKLKAEKQRFVENFEKDFKQEWQNELQERQNQLLEKHKLEVDEHNKNLKAELSNQLRRLNIKHPKFPEKYRQLFNQTRVEFF